jgi:general secretion pathway protein G
MQIKDRLSAKQLGDMGQEMELPNNSIPSNAAQAQPVPQTSKLAVISFVLGLLSWSILPIIAAIAAVITGHRAKKEIRTSNGRLKGKGFAAWALILGYLSLVIVPMAILGFVFASPAIAVRLEQAQRDRAVLDIRTLDSALNLYRTRTGAYPDTKTGLKALVDAQLLETIPKDPWGRDYVYVNNGTSASIVSYGQDGVPGGKGPDADISNSDQGR